MENSLPPNSLKYPAGAVRILIVEDDFWISNVVADMLKHEGYHVDCAPDGEAGWAALCAKPFDLLITDEDMPKLTGMDLLRKARGALFNLPAIMISGDVPWNEPDLMELLTPGVAMTKPFSFPELLTNVRDLLHPKKPTREAREQNATDNFNQVIAQQYWPATV